MAKFDISNIIQKLPDTYSKEDTSNIFKLLQLFSEQLNDLEEVKEDIENGHKIDLATGNALDLIGTNVQQKRGSLDDDIYRKLLLSKILINNSPGDVNSIIQYLSLFFNTDKENIHIVESEQGTFTFSDTLGVAETNEEFGFANIAMTSGGTIGTIELDPAYFKIIVPPGVFSDMGISVNNMEQIIQLICPAGVDVDMIEEGTFEFSSQDGIVENNINEGFATGGTMTDGGTLGYYFSSSTDVELPI